MAKSYQIYGIGNALVDMEFAVSLDDLANANIEKGLMTLIEKDKQKTLLETFKPKFIKRSCGGSAANTIIAAAQLGAKCFYSCKVANDETGDFYFKDLSAKGVSNNLEGERKEGDTGTCIVLTTPDADRSMNTFLGITATFSKEQIIVDELKKAEYLYIEGYLVTSADGIEAAKYAKSEAEKAGVKTALTLSDPGIVSFFKAGFAEMIGTGVDLLFCNEAEAMSYTEKEDLDSALNELAKVAKTVVVTRGPKGAVAFKDGEKTIIETEAVNAVDSNGAGDLFAGAFLYAISNGHDFATSGRLACHCSGLLVTQYGARLEDEQIQKVKNTILG